MTSRRTASRSALAPFVALAVVIGACGGAAGRLPTTDQRPNARLQELVAAARDEGELALSWSPGFLDTPEELRRETEAFNALYGLALRVRFTPGGPMGEATARLLQEQQSGATASTDVLLGTETQIVALQKAAALAPEQWSSWASNVSSLKLVAPGGVAVQVQTRIPGITYNSRKLTGNDVPRSLADLLKPQYKGRVATTSDGAGFDRLGSPEVWGGQRTLDFVGRLRGQIGGVMSCGDEGRLLAGELDIFVLDCGSARVSQLKAEGTLIGWSVPADAALLRYLYMGVPKNAAHPSAARLWINFMLSRAAQDLMYQYGYADHHLLPGSRSFAEIDRSTKAGVKFYEVTVEGVQVEEASGAKPLAPQIQALLRDAAPRR